MALLITGIGIERGPSIEGHGVVLRPPLLSDYAAWAELRNMSRPQLQPWEPLWPKDDLTRSAYRRRVRHYQREARDDLGYAFAVIEAVSGRLAGGVTLSNVARGVTQSATLGYWLGTPFMGRGLMTSAVAALVPHAFGALRLHRLEAAVQPLNIASIRTLERNGFTREGYLRRYLKIAGIWQDHFIYGLLEDDAAVTGRPPQ